MITANLKDKIGYTESINRAVRIKRFTIHTAFEVSPLESHYFRNSTTDLTNIVEKNKSYLSDWKTLNVSVPLKQIQIYAQRTEKGDLTNHIIMAKTKFRALRPAKLRRETKQNSVEESSTTSIHF